MPGKNIRVGCGLGAGVLRSEGPCTTSHFGGGPSGFFSSLFCSDSGNKGMKYGDMIFDEPADDNERLAIVVLAVADLATLDDAVFSCDTSTEQVDLWIENILLIRITPTANYVKCSCSGPFGKNLMGGNFSNVVNQLSVSHLLTSKNRVI